MSYAGNLYFPNFVKVNRKTILIENVDNTFDRMKVSVGLLIKA